MKFETESDEEMKQRRGEAGRREGESKVKRSEELKNNCERKATKEKIRRMKKEKTKEEKNDQ